MSKLTLNKSSPKNKTVIFDSLEVLSVFIWKCNPYLKMAEKNYDGCNAICLTYGNQVSFSGQTEVIPCNATLSYDVENKD